MDRTDLRQLNSPPGGRHQARWVPLLSAEITLLHVVEPVTYPGFYTHYTLREEYLGRITKLCHEALAGIGEEFLQAVPYDTALVHDQAATGISEFASSNDFDLVVLATRGLSGISHAVFGSVAERVTNLSEVPVLTVRNQPPIPEEKPRRKPKAKKGRKTPAGAPQLPPLVAGKNGGWGKGISTSARGAEFTRH